jgi:hypothetical protein
MAASLNSIYCTRLPRTCLFQPLSPLILVAWTRVHLIDRESGLLERFRRYCRLTNARMMDKQLLVRTVNKGIFLTVSFVPESQPSAILAQKKIDTVTSGLFIQWHCLPPQSNAHQDEVSMGGCLLQRLALDIKSRTSSLGFSKNVIRNGSHEESVQQKHWTWHHVAAMSAR